MSSTTSDGASVQALWELLQEANVESPWQGTLSRVVESQQRIATLHLVDSLEEQAVLEALIDQAKPPASIDHDKFHYLISSPFRYPPLRHGSRFGSRYEPSLFYGSLSIQCALAECAYYRFVFLEGMSEPIAAPVRSEHSSFEVRCRAGRAIRLNEPPADRYSSVISHPSDYAFSQTLGSKLRETGTELIHYLSARFETGINVAVFSIDAIVPKSPERMQYWRCVTHADRLTFTLVNQQQKALEGYAFQRSDFLQQGGTLPLPAS